MGQTPSQTVGPFFAYALTPESYGKVGIAGSVLAGRDAEGEHIRVGGTVTDGNGDPVSDALLEIWQADAQGRLPGRGSGGTDPALSHFGRVETKRDGSYLLETVKPGSIVDDSGPEQAPHLLVAVFARGLLNHMFTRIYFSDEARRNATDPVLEAVEPQRRATLIATREATRPDYSFDVRLQGEDETVFFDV